VSSEPEQTAFIRIQNNEIMIEEGVPRVSEPMCLLILRKQD